MKTKHLGRKIADLFEDIPDESHPEFSVFTDFVPEEKRFNVFNQKVDSFFVVLVFFIGFFVIFPWQAIAFSTETESIPVKISEFHETNVVLNGIPFDGEHTEDEYIFATSSDDGYFVMKEEKYSEILIPLTLGENVISFDYYPMNSDSSYTIRRTVYRDEFSRKYHIEEVTESNSLPISEIQKNTSLVMEVHAFPEKVKLRVSVDGNAAKEYSLVERSVVFFDAKESISIWTSNGESTVITLNAREYGPLGTLPIEENRLFTLADIN